MIITCLFGLVIQLGFFSLEIKLRFIFREVLRLDEFAFGGRAGDELSVIELLGYWYLFIGFGVTFEGNLQIHSALLLMNLFNVCRFFLLSLFYFFMLLI